MILERIQPCTAFLAAIRGGRLRRRERPPAALIHRGGLRLWVSVRGVTAAIRGYQALSSARTPRCRYWPTCSQYAIEALETHGLAKGGWMALLRLTRCHPWSGHGVDPVPTPAEVVSQAVSRSNISYRSDS